jgi:hypothetical protein
MMEASANAYCIAIGQVCSTDRGADVMSEYMM